MKVQVYGHSDDVICVDGDIRDEFYGKYLHFDDGTVIRCEYAPEDDANYFWRFTPVRTGEGTKIERVPGTYDGEDGMRCDKLVIEGHLDYVHSWEEEDGPSADDFARFMARTLARRGLTLDQRTQIIAIVEERNLMHVCDAGQFTDGTNYLRFQCRRCGYDSGQMTSFSSEDKRGRTCETNGISCVCVIYATRLVATSARHC